jgi:hypothetical protein
MGLRSSLQETWTSISRRLGRKPSTGRWYPDQEFMRRQQEELLSETMDQLFRQAMLASISRLQEVRQSVCSESTRECRDKRAALDTYLQTLTREPFSISEMTAATTKFLAAVNAATPAKETSAASPYNTDQG